MKPSINLFSEKDGEIKKFLDLYFSKNFNLNNDFSYKQDFDSPIEMIDFLCCFIDNNYNFKINLWITIDKNVYIRVTDQNLDQLIKYFYERYPY